MAKDNAATYKEFQKAVNMTASELEIWLKSDESKEIGDKSSGGESTGHASGRRIVFLLRSKKGDLTRDDLRPHAQGDRLRPPAFGATPVRRHHRFGVALLPDELGTRPV
jgi:Protein of unknown function (DUF3140)